MSMIDAIALLFVCQLLGEVIHRALGVPLPGSVLGMLLLMAWMAIWQKKRPTLTAVTTWLTAHLAVMFVPFAVGLIENGPMLSRYGVALVVAVTLSTTITMVVTVLIFRWMARDIPEKELES